MELGKLESFVALGLMVLCIVVIQSQLTVAQPSPPVNVTGFIFHNDSTGTENGTHVVIKNVNLSQIFYTEVSAPPIPSLKGAYLTSINGSVGDYLIVRGFNDSHYGESNATVTNLTMYVNVTFDLFRPNVTLIAPSNASEIGKGLRNMTYSVVDYALDNCTLYISLDGGSFDPVISELAPDVDVNNSLETYLDIGFHVWNVLCVANSSYAMFALHNFTVNVTPPDIMVSEDSIWFSNDPRIETSNVTVFVNLTNLGLSEINDTFVVQFFRGDPDSGGEQLNGNLSVSNMESGENLTLNLTFELVLGLNNIFVVADSDNSILELNDSNNKANNTVNVELYQYYYGDVQKNIVLGDSNASIFIDFLNASGVAGNVYFTDADSSISFTELRAFTRTENDLPASSDFTELDFIMNTSTFNDSIKNVWGDGTDVPVMVDQFSIYGTTLNNVPVINSTVYDAFRTGILWDSDDDSGNLEFDSVDQEDVVFVVKINASQVGSYGTYDYEVKVPATLREYKGVIDKLVFYVEII